MCLPRTRFSKSGRFQMFTLCMFAIQRICPWFWIAAHTGTEERQEKGRGKKNSPPPRRVLSSNLCPPATACASALHPGRPVTLTHPPASTLMLLGGFSSTLRMTAEWSPSCNSCVIAARTGTSLQQRAVVERTHATVRLRGEASPVCKLQDRREVGMVHRSKVTGSLCAVVAVYYKDNKPRECTFTHRLIYRIFEFELRLIFQWHPNSIRSNQLWSIEQKRGVSVNMFWFLCEGPPCHRGWITLQIYATAHFTKLERH